MDERTNDTAAQGTQERTRWAMPLGALMLVVGLLGAWLLPHHIATTFTGIFVAVAVAGLVLVLSALWQRHRGFR